MNNNLSLFGDEPSFDVPARPLKPAKPAKPAMHLRNLLRPMSELTLEERILVYAQFKHDLACLENDWKELHVRFLHHRLHQLANPNTTADVKEEIWAWLEEPEEPLVLGCPVPFNAQTCLAACDREIDVKEFRHCLRRFLRRLDAERLAAAA